MQQHSTSAQEIKTFEISSLIKRPVGPLDPSAPRLDDQGERSHAATADAAEKVISKLGHRRKLQWLPMRCNAVGHAWCTRDLDEQEVQDRRRRAGFVHVCGVRG